LIINVMVLYVLTQYFGIYYLVSNFIGIVCGFLTNFLLSNHWAWGDANEK